MSSLPPLPPDLATLLHALRTLQNVYRREDMHTEERLTDLCYKLLVLDYSFQRRAQLSKSSRDKKRHIVSTSKKQFLRALAKDPDFDLAGIEAKRLAHSACVTQSNDK